MTKRHYTIASPGQDDRKIYGTAGAAQEALRARHAAGDAATLTRTPRSTVRREQRP